MVSFPGQCNKGHVVAVTEIVPSHLSGEQRSRKWQDHSSEGHGENPFHAPVTASGGLLADVGNPWLVGGLPGHCAVFPFCTDLVLLNQGLLTLHYYLSLIFLHLNQSVQPKLRDTCAKFCV